MQHYTFGYLNSVCTSLCTVYGLKAKANLWLQLYALCDLILCVGETVFF